MAVVSLSMQSPEYTPTCRSCNHGRHSATSPARRACNPPGPPLTHAGRVRSRPRTASPLSTLVPAIRSAASRSLWPDALLRVEPPHAPRARDVQQDAPRNDALVRRGDGPKGQPIHGRDVRRPTTVVDLPREVRVTNGVHVGHRRIRRGKRSPSRPVRRPHRSARHTASGGSTGSGFDAERRRSRSFPRETTRPSRTRPSAARRF